MVDKKTVAKYLAQGIPTQQVAAAVGCEESYISQLRADPEIIVMIAELTVATTARCRLRCSYEQCRRESTRPY